VRGVIQSVPELGIEAGFINRHSARNFLTKSIISRNIEVHRLDINQLSAFVLAMMLTYGSDFTIDDLPTVDRTTSTPPPQPFTYPITIVNRKTFKVESEYIGRTMPGLTGSPLANQYKVKPHGPFTREDSVLKLYRTWLWNETTTPKQRFKTTLS
jgi:hypothetical protein